LQANTSYNKLLVKISWLSASSIIKYVLQFATIILFANKLTQEQYGNYQHIWIVINLFCTLIPFGFTALLLSTNTASLLQWINKKKKIIIAICTITTTTLAIYLFFGMSSFTLNEQVFLFLFILFQIAALIGEAILIKQAKEKTIFWINTIYFIAYFLLHYFIVMQYYNIATLLLGLIIITIVKTFFLFIQKNKNEFTFTEENNIPKEWIYLGTNDVLNVIVKWLDKWIILLFWPTASFASYFNGTYEIPIFLLLLGAVGSVSIVEISKLKLDNAIAIVAIFKKPILVLATIALPSFAFLFFNASNLFSYLFSNKYNASVPIFIITLLIIPARVVYSTSVLQVFDKSKIIVQGVLLDLVLAIIFMASLYPIIGLKGLALAFVLSTYIQVYYYLWHTSKLLRQSVSSLVPFFSLALILIISLIIASSAFVLTTKCTTLIAIALNSIACLINMIVVYFLFEKPKKI
jgi:O-antigen/teichoic acid export membrane protein